MNSDCAKNRTTSPATSSGAPANGSGTSWNEPAIPAISAWCASAARYSSVASASWNSPITVTLCDVSGLMMFTTAKPIWMSMISPANWIPVNSRNATNPNTSPTNTCARIATVSIPSPPSGAIGGTVRTTTNASSSAQPEAHELRDLRLREDRHQEQHRRHAHEHEQHHLELPGRQPEDVERVRHGRRRIT